jgi:hypothetical protein
MGANDRLLHQTKLEVEALAANISTVLHFALRDVDTWILRAVKLTFR